MSKSESNPFQGIDEDREAIWEMLVRRDIDAFLASDWDAVCDDFLDEQFVAVDAGHSADISRWMPGFDTLEAYKLEWLRQAQVARETLDQTTIRAELFALTSIVRISINGQFAVVHKVFDGDVTDIEGNAVEHRWQSLYYCRKVEQDWKISGFLGYLPNPLVE